MNEEPDLEGIEPHAFSTEEAMDAVISAIKCGELTFIDGVMSPLSFRISARLGATEFDMNSWWIETPQDWICPACGRGKADIARLNTKGEIMCHLVEHHDHMKDVLKRRFQEISVSRQEIIADAHAENFAKRSATMISAYENTLICVDCNNADALAKKATAANRDFSFSPQELRLIVKPQPNKAHEIDVDVAKAIWAERLRTFELRMKIADRIAEIAANNEHWFQPGNFNNNPDVISRRAEALVAHKRAFGVLKLLKGQKKTKPAKPLSSWRHFLHHPPKPLPTPNEIKHAGLVGNPKFWNMISEEWRCPGCQRNKREIVRKNKNGEWTLPIATRFFYDSNLPRSRKDILACGDCVITASSLGKEAESRASGKIQGGYTAQVHIQEIQECVIPKPHTRHNINNKKAESIIEDIARRMLQGNKKTE